MYSDLLPTGPDETPYRLITTEGVSTFTVDGRTFLKVDPEVIRLLTAEAIHDISHYLRPAHLRQLRKIIDDPEASGNDRFVALDLLKNVNISAGGILPMCQDTGTAIVMGKKGQQVWTHGADGTPGGDEEALARGVFRTYTETNLRYSQVAPITIVRATRAEGSEPGTMDTYRGPAGRSDTRPTTSPASNATTPSSSPSGTASSSSPGAPPSATASSTTVAPSGNRAGG